MSKLYVGNLSFKSSESDIHSLFSEHGPVAQVEIMMDKMTGRPRGFAFVTMETAEGAKAAIAALNGTNFEGRDLTVNEARPREDRPRSFSGGGGGGGGGNRGMARTVCSSGVILVMFFYGRKHGIPFYNLAEATALCAPVGLALGRIANFINGELWGRPATVPWAVIFPAAPDNLPRHPSQLYEAFGEGVLLFCLLIFVRTQTRRDGVVSLTFVAAYAVARITCEFFREPDEQIGYWFGAVTQGQLLSAGMILLAAVLAWLEFRQKKESPSS